FCHRDDNEYVGEYHYGPKTKVIHSCPAHACMIKDLMKNIKNRSHIKGAAATRNHTEAMPLADLKHIMKWSEMACPPMHCKSLEGMMKGQVLLAMKHLFMCTFMTTSFTIWTRNFELCMLQYSNLTMDCIGEDGVPYFLVKLENRKGWRSQVGYDGDCRGHTYEIYKQDVDEMDMYTHLHHWLDFLRMLLSCTLHPSDLVFPHISCTTAPHSWSENSQETIQQMINVFTKEAGMTTHYTTHCSHRGGAQYCFMFTPFSEQWSLCRIRWWGSWAKGEHVDTLMKYLIDSLQSHETSHSSALHPNQCEADKNFMGDQKPSELVTVNEFHTFTGNIMSMIKSEVKDIKLTISSITIPVPSHEPAHLLLPPYQTIQSDESLPTITSFTHRQVVIMPNRHDRPASH
ncbi:hypothetical protein AX17_005581, partial [Amanita inopinata Kibby_2008]